MIIKTSKLQLLGSSTLYVSLPKPWIKENGLKKGDTVAFFYDDDGHLCVKPWSWPDNDD